MTNLAPTSQQAIKSSTEFKPSAVIDKCLLQNICELTPDESRHLLRVLQARFSLIITPILIQETIVSFFRADTAKKSLFHKMLKAIQEMQPILMETPLELIFREFILRKDIHSDWQPDSDIAEKYWETISDPDSISKEATRWIEDLRQEKQERLTARIERQTLVAQASKDEDWRFSSGADFMERIICRLCHEVDHSAEVKKARLDYYLGRNLKMRHPDCETLITKAIGEATFDNLDKTRFTRNYLLAEVIYDFAPISEIPDKDGNSLKVLNPCNQRNDEEDQQYVASALACWRLLTCDRRMNLIANLFSKRKLWWGLSLYIPPKEIEKLEDHLQ